MRFPPRPAAKPAGKLRGELAGDPDPLGRSGPPVGILGMDGAWLGEDCAFYMVAGAAIAWHLAHGVFQELVVVELFERKLSSFVTLLQYLGFLACALGLRGASPRSRRVIPLKYHVLLACCATTNISFTFLSLRWLNYPTKTLIKSTRIIFTMLASVLLWKRRYAAADWAIAATLCVGLAVFVCGDSMVSSSFTPAGLVCVCVALFAEVGKSSLQEWLLRTFEGSGPREIVLYESLFGSVGMLLLNAADGSLLEGLRVVFLTDKTASILSSMACMTLAGFAGTSAITFLVSRYGAVSASVTTTVRKAASISFSYAIFPKPLSKLHITGGMVFLGGLLAKAMMKRRRCPAPAGRAAEGPRKLGFDGRVPSGGDGQRCQTLVSLGTSGSSLTLEDFFVMTGGRGADAEEAPTESGSSSGSDDSYDEEATLGPRWRHLGRPAVEC